MRILDDFRQLSLFPMAASSCNHVDSIQRRKSYNDASVKNGWRWEWCEKIVDGTRLESTGMAYCSLCRKEIAYGSKGFTAIDPHLTRGAHKANLKTDHQIKHCQVLTSSHKFCGHRWLENVRVAERALEIWSKVKEYVKKVRGNKLQEPTCKSYSTLESMVKDCLLKTKVHAFISLAKELRPFQATYQTDAPMQPFLAEDLLKVIKSLLRRIFTTKALSELSSPKDILDLKMDDKSQYLDKSIMDIGLAASKSLKEARPSELQKYELRDDFWKFVFAITKKLLLKAPVNNRNNYLKTLLLFIPIGVVPCPPLKVF